ncbi:FMN-binding negative transcriptional regulator [Sodalis praecaptivus]|uniref:FMN-binding negative transcriptional regulator n=1 Tax=Sodalis praecaptivus TaxID=1239307 RepID=K7SKA6_9GAMM|nr:FMN-binding negative transcriptional regulator [Sodalis praecaptivus]AFW03739.1 FMN-binding negative transcriptional regulator [Sodalis praecaptivus]AHF77721.1 FMN-binding negative transcriptional regulator [Sodalis praecaptivus]
MYIPPAFRQTDVEAQRALIAAHPLAQLISLGEQGLQADPLPLLLDSYPDGAWRLRGHLARANPHGKSLARDGACLVIFQGEAGYISPGWYAAKAEHGKVVPTWNYQTVHCHGQAQMINDPAWLMALLRALTDNQEARRQAPWRVEDAPAGFIDTLIGAIVGIEIRVTRTEAKWKLSQNRSRADRDGAIAGLMADGNGPLARAMGRG